MLNIPSHIKDPNYRYKMPKLACTIQGQGNGTKTKLDNILDVSKALNIPPDYPLKFIGKEIGSQTDIKNDIYLINGNHSAEKLQQLLDK
jgi:translation initiation factor 5